MLFSKVGKISVTVFSKSYFRLNKCHLSLFSFSSSFSLRLILLVGLVGQSSCVYTKGHHARLMSFQSYGKEKSRNSRRRVKSLERDVKVDFRIGQLKWRKCANRGNFSLKTVPDSSWQFQLCL